MLQLQTNKANFLFKNTQDSYYTIYVGPQDINVFPDSPSFYFYAIISIKYLDNYSRNGTISKLKSFGVLVLNTCLRMENSYGLFQMGFPNSFKMVAQLDVLNCRNM